MSQVERRLKDGGVAIYRHPLLVRATHWVNAFCLLILLLSGLQILNAHPAFYWGEDSRFAKPALSFTAYEDAQGELHGRTHIGGLHLETTGFLGASRQAGGDQLEPRAFPHWLTLPSYRDLGMARRWHFFFAWFFVLNGAAYVAYALITRRVKVLWPTMAQMRGFGRSLWDHLRLRFAHGEEARDYNVLQKLAYLAVIFGLLPLMVFTGLAMSPGMDARLPILSELFGGRQSARFVHFLSATGLVAFFVVHIAMVIAAGPITEMRSILTGWFVIRKGPAK